MELEKIVSWAKRRGFVFQSSEIYGGLSGVYDFGPLGIELKNNIKRFWRKRFLFEHDDIVGLDSAVLMNRKVWQASSHEKSFADPLTECKKCHMRFREDEVEDVKHELGGTSDWDNLLDEKKKMILCPDGQEHKFIEAKNFNLMLKTFLGPVEDTATQTYLRPETAQGMFINFKQILETSRQKIPFGIAQIGKSFRNEITPKNFLYRMREFEIAEIEYFTKPDEDEKWFDYFLKQWRGFFLDIGLKKENMKLHEHPKKDLAHYSKRTVDILYKFPFGWQELAGVANRTDFDLKNHQKASGKDLQYFDQEINKKYLPYVIEPTLGIERLMLALICDGLEEINGGRTKTTESIKEETVFKILPKLAPIKVAVLPLVKKLSKKAKEVYKILKSEFACIYDEEGTIGRRYRRNDEIGTPFCVTIDFETLKDKAVTVRDRDTMKQKRIKIAELKTELIKKLN